MFAPPIAGGRPNMMWETEMWRGRQEIIAQMTAATSIGMGAMRLSMFIVQWDADEMGNSVPRWIPDKRILDGIMAGSIVLCQRTGMASPTWPRWGRVRTHMLHSLYFPDIISSVLDDSHDERHIPVTPCHKFVWRSPLGPRGSEWSTNSRQVG